MNKITLEFHDKELGQQYLAKQRRKAIVLYAANAARLAFKLFVYLKLLRTYLAESPEDEVLVMEEQPETGVNTDECVCGKTDVLDPDYEVLTSTYLKTLTLLAMFDVCCFQVITFGLLMVKMKKSTLGRIFDSQSTFCILMPCLYRALYIS